MINSYIQIIEKKYISKIDEKAADYFTYVTDGARRLQQMIDDLALYSKILRYDYEYIFTNINQIALKVKDSILKQNLKNDIIINIDKLPSCFCYPELFELLLRHLLCNALKFNLNQPIINVRCVKNNTVLTFEVEDNGIGIESKYSDEIFKIFRKLHTNNDYPGTGIGLAICKKIVEKHNGKIWFSNSNSGGTIFYFTLTTDK